MEYIFRRFVDGNPGPSGPPRIGLVLSSGGARGLAHIGAIQVLEEARIPIAALIGSSMGAYIGALWASGVDGKGLADLAAEIKDRRTLLRLLDPALPPVKGFLRGEKLRRHLQRTLANTKIEDLRRKMFIVATNLDSVSDEVLPADMPVAAAVHASCAIPGICAPVHLNGKRYIDGGAAQPLPVNLLKRLVQLDHVIAVNVMPTASDIDARRLNSFPIPPDPPTTAMRKVWNGITNRVNLFAYGNVLDTFKRCLTSAQLRLITEESACADVLVHPFFGESKWYDFENFNTYIEAGRHATEAALPLIHALLTSNPSKSPAHETVPFIPAVGCGTT
ncbi:MAG TPA: patatin-like phospholipase family protein [Verrucomicrobiaceae bacterium]